jgi:SAM-dependent methyltransferase
VRGHGSMIQRLAAAVTKRMTAVGARLRRKPYTRAFYVEQDAMARRSAETVVPLVIELVDPRSVVDVGCGSGAWLAAFFACGVEDILGVESEDVPADVLTIPAARVLRHDLRRPLAINRRFDLVVCLEVAEHLPVEAGDDLISSLTSLGSLVLFSAAIPHQGGASHINEQWPEFWAETFSRRGYVAVDCLRRKVWSEASVAWWYAQNMLIFVERSALENCTKLRAEFDLMGTSQLSMVHPRCYESRRRALRRFL